MGSSKTDALSPENETSFLVRYDVRRVLDASRVVWRLHERRVDPDCERACNKKDKAIRVPPRVVPADEVDIAIRE